MAVVTEEDVQLVVRQTEFARQFDLGYAELHKLMHAYGATELNICLSLLKTKKFRSAYRQACAEKIRHWLECGIASRPLTDREIKYCTPTWAVHFDIPR